MNITFLDVIIRQSTSIFELFAGKYQTLLIGWDTFFVLYFGFNIFDCVRRLYLEGNGLTRKGFHENLHGEVF